MPKKRTFHADTFCINTPADCRTYEKIMQSVLDGDGEFEVVSSKENWDKLGNFSVALQYFQYEKRMRRKRKRK